MTGIKRWVFSALALLSVGTSLCGDVGNVVEASMIENQTTCIETLTKTSSIENSEKQSKKEKAQNKQPSNDEKNHKEQKTSKKDKKEQKGEAFAFLLICLMVILALDNNH